ncbi:hypothetical protein [Croceibacterium mercuriale]|uniref:hypothetical protein n=1 Tax=Croceibacterium mercuriale TaxID=1572751 RepID=UPI000689FC18|nr:hypothetical protein [Croceibacterium mercuriale]
MTTRKPIRPWQPYLKVPPFLPVPLRTRRDGWTPARQARFIALLVRHACVRTAAAALGLSRESAYRLRRHPDAGSFRVAWDTAITGKRQRAWKFTRSETADLAHHGPFHLRLWRGKVCDIIRKPINNSLLSLITRLDRLLAHLSPAQCTTLLGHMDPLAHYRRLLSGPRHRQAGPPIAGDGTTMLA